MSISPEQNARKYHKIKTGNKTFENVANQKWLGKNPTIKFAFRKKIRAQENQRMLATIGSRIFVS
jgi:hypothetical protein